MKKIRLLEEGISNRYDEGNMRCPTHLSIGQEAVATGVCSSLTKKDLALSGHRAHAHYIAKGGCINSMLCEIYGKIDGCSSGKGGSMHLIDNSAGFSGSTAIVGGTVPVGVGLAYGLKIKRKKNLCCIFIGDAVLETGVFYESLNFSILKKLPVLFVCENNLYSVYSPLEVRQPEGRKIHKMLEAMGIKTFFCDGNNVIDVYKTSNEAVNFIKKGNGPVFIEFSTYRWLEHCGPNYDNDLGYRTTKEFETWKKKDPILNFEKYLIKSGFKKEEILNIEKKLRLEIDNAFKYAEKSKFPKPQYAFQDLFFKK